MVSDLRHCKQTVHLYLPWLFATTLAQTGRSYSYTAFSGNRIYSRPPQYRRPPNTAALPIIPLPIFKSKIWVLYVIYDSQYRRFRNTAAFSPVPRSAVLRGLTVPLLELSKVVEFAYPPCREPTCAEF